MRNDKTKSELYDYIMNTLPMTLKTICHLDIQDQPMGGTGCYGIPINGNGNDNFESTVLFITPYWDYLEGNSDRDIVIPQVVGDINDDADVFTLPGFSFPEEELTFVPLEDSERLMKGLREYLKTPEVVKIFSTLGVSLKD